MGQTRRLTELREEILRRACFPPPPHAIGLSGGADSAVLAWLAPGESRCVHVHHGLAASDALADAAASIAEKLSLAIDVVHIEVPVGPSPEAMAREARYNAFASSVGPEEALLLGHTRNDQAETLLLNLIRGAGTRGLSGMPYMRPPNIYRPFLDVTRSETREAAALAGLPFVDDPTNADLSLTRNHVRLRILPLLEAINPGLVDGLARTADNLRIDSEYLDRKTAETATPEVDGGFARLPVGVLLAADGPIRVRLLSSMLSTLRQAPGAAELERMEAVLLGKVVAAELEGKIRVERSGAYLVCRRTV